MRAADRPRGTLRVLRNFFDFHKAVHYPRRSHTILRIEEAALIYVVSAGLHIAGNIYVLDSSVSSAGDKSAPTVVNGIAESHVLYHAVRMDNSE